MSEDSEILINDPAANVDVLLAEFKQAGVLPNGWYDIAFNQEKRRMIWAGQSPDGRKWDENLPEGEPARPWNGAADTRIPMIDAVCNDDTAVLCTAYDRAELRAGTVDPDQAELAAGVSNYLHWMTKTRYRRALKTERELAAQYSREHGWCVAYVGWERELSKRRVRLTLDQLAQFVQTSGGGSPSEAGDPKPAGPGELAPADAILLTLLDPAQEDAAVELFREAYRLYVTAALQNKGFYEQELQSDAILKISVATARRCLGELRRDQETEVPMPYVCRNNPLVWVLQPYLEILTSRGTMMLQQSRAIFWRRWMTEAELESKTAEGWDPEWIKEVRKTKGNIASWAGALGATSITGPSTKTVGNTTFLKVTEENNPLIEVLYAFVKKVDGDGVTAVWETVFSPHITKKPNGRGEDFYAKHELLDYAHGRYPFVELKRENIGRALIDTRSVAEVAGTWQDEEKIQRDFLANRSQWDTLPPVKVPSLGGVDYRLGPGAQVPIKRNDTFEPLLLGAGSSPQLSIELIQLLRLQKDDYFGQFNPGVDPAKITAKQNKSASDFYDFWAEIFLHMFALTLQYNPQEIVRVTSIPQLANLDPFDVLDQFNVGLEFDVQELNPDYLLKKMKMIHEFLLPADAGGVIDRSSLTGFEMGMLDSRLRDRVIQDRGQAAQKVYREVDTQVMRMAVGNEAEYTQNDPAAPMKLQFLGTVLQSNPKYQQWLRSDPEFQKLLQAYQNNLQMSVDQQQNKTVGRLGVKPMTNAPQAAA